MRARRFLKALTLTSVLSAACSSQPAPAEKPAEAPKPEWTADQSAQKYQDCWDQFNRKDWTAFRSCYNPAITVEAVDSGRPVASGLDAAIKERQYADNTTVLAQLGVIKAPTRPVMAAATGAPTVVVSTGSDTERANVETFRANMKAFNDHDVKTLADMNAADGVFHDYTQPKDVDGKGNIAALGELFKGFPDAKVEAATSWGAGDYVVTEGTFSGTNTGAVPTMGIKKPSGKSARVRFLEITKIEGGKIKEDWLVFDSAAFAAQLGL